MPPAHLPPAPVTRRRGSLVSRAVSMPLRHWAPDVALGALVLGAALAESADRGIGQTWVAVWLAITVGLLRRGPGIAVGLLWLLLVLHVATGTPLLALELATILVAFGAARWGRVLTVWLSGLSIFALAAICTSALAVQPMALLWLARSFAAPEQLKRVVLDGAGTSAGLLLLPLVVTLGLFGVPWLVGMALRSVRDARRSRELHRIADEHRVLAQAQAASERTAAERERALAEQQRAIAEQQRELAEQQRQIAELRGGQAQLAHDVHDVVAHSLTVILAQAQAAAYLEDPAQVQATTSRIAEAARRSLRDVRAVLDSAREPGLGGAPVPGSMTSLVEDLRGTGHEVRLEVVGAPQPLPPELETVAYRVVQEMLTNAVRHGARTAPVHVEQYWEPGTGPGAPGWLRVRVVNSLPDLPNLPARHGEGGLGIAGMRRRAGAVGGRVTAGPEGTDFVATAWLPIRPRLSTAAAPAAAAPPHVGTPQERTA